MGSRCVATCTLREVFEETAGIFSSPKKSFSFCFLEKERVDVARFHNE